VDATVYDPPKYNGCCGYLYTNGTSEVPKIDLWLNHNLYEPGNSNSPEGPYTHESGKATRHMVFHQEDITLQSGHENGDVQQVTLDWGDDTAIDTSAPGNPGWVVEIEMQNKTVYKGYFTVVWCRACLPTWDHMGSFKITEISESL